MHDIFSKIVILTQDERKASVDKQALRHAGFANVHTMTSGLELAFDLADVHINHLERDTLVFCQTIFEDMNAFDFLKLIRLHPFLAHQPLIFIGSSKSESGIYLQQGFTQALTRPLTAVAVEEAVQYCVQFETSKRKELLAQVHEQGTIPSSKPFFALLEEFRLGRKTKVEKIEPEMALYDGLEILKRGQVEKAMALLMKATSQTNVAGEAHETLAKIYKQQGKTKFYLKHLEEAVANYALINDMVKMLELAVEYREHMEYPVHPLTKYLHKYIKEDRLQEYVSLLESLDVLFPARRELQAMVQACLNSDDPKGAANKLRSYLAELNFTFYDDLYYSVMQKSDERSSKRESVVRTKLMKDEREKKDRAERVQERKIQEKRVLLEKVNVEELPDFGADPDKIPQIPMIDEGSEKVYLGGGRENLVWSIIKGTAHAYKKTK